MSESTIEHAPLGADESAIGDLDWDSIPTDEFSGEGEDTSAGDQESNQEVENSDSGDGGEKPGEEDKQAEEEAADPSGENKEGEAESDSSDREKVDAEGKEEQILEVKINGKYEKVTLDELKQNYSGKIAYDKKFSELDKERQSYKKEIGEINNYINEFGSKMRNGDGLGALQYLAEFAGIPPYEVKENILKQVLPELERRAGLDPEQIQYEQREEAHAYNQKRLEAEKQKFEQEQANTSLQSQVQSEMSQNNIDADEWDNTVRELDSELPPSQEILPKHVTQRILLNRAGARAEKLLDEVSSDIDIHEGLLSDLQEELINYPYATDEQVRQALLENFASVKKEAAKEAIEERVSSNKNKKESPKNKKVAMNTEIEEIPFDDWDDLL